MMLRYSVIKLRTVSLMNTKLCHVNLKTHLELEVVTQDRSALCHSCSIFICHLNGIMMFARIL